MHVGRDSSTVNPDRPNCKQPEKQKAIAYLPKLAAKVTAIKSAEPFVQPLGRSNA